MRGIVLGLPISLALWAAIILGLHACTVALGHRTALNLGFDGRVSHRANAARPRWYVGLRLSVLRHP